MAETAFEVISRCRVTSVSSSMLGFGGAWSSAGTLSIRASEHTVRHATYVKRHQGESLHPLLYVLERRY